MSDLLAAGLVTEVHLRWAVIASFAPTCPVPGEVRCRGRN